jgi:hypothetical protein
MDSPSRSFGRLLMRDYDDEDDQFIVTDEFDPETLQLMKDLGI